MTINPLCAHRDCPEQTQRGKELCYKCFSALQKAKPCRHPIDYIVERKIELQTSYGDERAQELIDEGEL